MTDAANTPTRRLHARDRTPRRALKAYTCAACGGLIPRGLWYERVWGQPVHLYAQIVAGQLAPGGQCRPAPTPRDQP